MKVKTIRTLLLFQGVIENGKIERIRRWGIQRFPGTGQISLKRERGLYWTAFHKQEKYSQAIEYGNKGLKIALEIEAEIPIMDAAEILHQSYNIIHHAEPAYEMLLLYHKTKDSLESEENRNEIIRKEYK